MHTNIARRVKVAAAALLAAGVLAASAAPAAAGWPHSGVTNHAGRVSAFHHHFYRGTQHRHVDSRPGADMMALADEVGPMDEAVSYCASRFRSYDPASGTYLGYDGNEHACP